MQETYQIICQENLYETAFSILQIKKKVVNSFESKAKTYLFKITIHNAHKFRMSTFEVLFDKEDHNPKMNYP